ncbi:MAG: SEL1-like repeat protein [Desulfamplus sp.]|nr:SEL1-like repeat protein [Desulfamplus sp.]
MIFKCSECGEPYDNKVNFCRLCKGKVVEENGKKDNEQTICVNCGLTLGDSMKFCHECGTPRTMNTSNGGFYAGYNNINQEHSSKQKINCRTFEEECQLFEYHIKAANEGNSEAHFNVGLCYLWGKGIGENEKKGFEYCLNAANQGSALAQLYVSACYYHGCFANKSEEKALDWYIKAIKQGDTVGLFNIKYHDGKGVACKYHYLSTRTPKIIGRTPKRINVKLVTLIDYLSSLRLMIYRHCGYYGDDKAYDILGIDIHFYYWYESFNNKTLPEFQWFKKAAEQGVPEAQFNVGTAYYHGNFVAKDEEKAFEWYMKAAEQGVPEAQFNVGTAYSRGVGVTENKLKAFEWFKKAAEQGVPEAQFNVGNAYYHGNFVAKDEEKAFEWYMKAAAQGDEDAQFRVGLCYYWGKGVLKNIIQAIIHFKTIESSDYWGLALATFIKHEKLLRSNIYIYGLHINIDEKIEKAISDYATNVYECDVLVLYDSTFFKSGKEGFIITDDLIMITSIEPQKQFDLKGKCYDFFNSRSFKTLPQEIQDSVVFMKQTYDEYFTL